MIIESEVRPTGVYKSVACQGHLLHLPASFQLTNSVDPDPIDHLELGSTPLASKNVLKGPAGTI